MSVDAAFLADFELVKGILEQPGAAADHRFSSSRVTLTCDPNDLDASGLTSFASRGNLVELHVRSGDDYSVRFVADGSAILTHQGGSGSLSTVAFDESEAEAAVQSGDIIRLLRLLPDPAVDLAVTLRAPEGADFVWSEDDLTTAAHSWVHLAQLLGSCKRLIVLDAGESWLTTASLVVVGPSAPAELDVTGEPKLTTAGDMTFAEPSHYVTVERHGLSATDYSLRKLANGVIWLALARAFTVEITDGELGTATVAYSADPSKVVDVEWAELAHSVDDAQLAVRFSDWLGQDDIAGRMEASRQAAGAVVMSPADLTDALAPVFRQARFIHDQSRTAAVAAVVEARRTAWLSTRESASDAASEARSAARSTADRSVAAVIASLAVVITHKTEVLTSAVSFVVLAAVLIGVGAAAAHSEQFEFPVTRSALNAALAELRTSQRHILQSEDVAEIVDGEVVTDARSTIAKAQRASRFALGLALAAVLLGALVVLLVDGAESSSTGSTPGDTSLPVPLPSQP